MNVLILMSVQFNCSSVYDPENMEEPPPPPKDVSV